ncbi:Zinc finger putative Transcription Factor family [Ditylenchus destructor]|uniref:Zinc finger putative Transcription Factor family n=1 Tax=Ditylenchus destructor TaxID=166010 RepID=A0AAD4N830_9BILA|nr:Zinc finger putative Transcription Factor family [Ditylenchus destructor]
MTTNSFKLSDYFLPLRDILLSYSVLHFIWYLWNKLFHGTQCSNLKKNIIEPSNFVSDKTNLECLLCKDTGTQWDSAEELEAHLAGDHFQCFPYSCDQCPFGRWPTEAMVKRHSHAHFPTEFKITCKWSPELEHKWEQIREALSPVVQVRLQGLGERDSDHPNSDKTSNVPIRENATIIRQNNHVMFL